MTNILSKLTGAVRTDWASPTAMDWLRAVGPLLAPLVIMLAGPRMDALGPVALTWMVLLVPGLLAANWWFPHGHPLGAGVARLGVASLLGLVPFGVVAYAGCLLHWRLTAVIWIYAGVYLAAVAVLGRALYRRDAIVPAEPPLEPFALPLHAPRWMSAVVLVAIAVVLAGVCMSAPNTHVSDTTFSDPAQRPGWWHGAVLAAIASSVAAVVLVMALRSRPGDGGVASTVHATASEGRERGRHSRPGKTKHSPDRTGFDVSRYAVVPLWIVCAVFTFHFMRATYSVSVPKMEQVDRSLGWDVDDVAYVSEAVDDQYDLPMGRYESSVGDAYALPRSRMSPLFAPLVGMLARTTGVESAALHHTVMPPLVVLVGVSCWAAALMVAFRMHRWAVPLGLLVVLILIYRSWDFPRCEVEMMIYRAMQGKGLHLWWPLPLQIASIVLLARTPTLRHLGLGAAVALIGHLTHPLATIMGLVMCTAVALIVLAERRGAFLKVLAMLVFYAGLGGEYRLTLKLNSDLPGLSTGRAANQPIESRDLIRSDVLKFSIGREFETDLKSGSVTPTLAKVFGDHDQNVSAGLSIGWSEAGGYYHLAAGRRGSFRFEPREDRFDVYQVDAEARPRHDPFWNFGCNSLYLAGSVAVPILLALGCWRREWMYIGALGAAVLISTNFEPLGRVLNVALPNAIFFRARWMLPALLNMAAIAAVICWAVQVVLRSRDSRPDAGRSILAAGVAVGAIALMVANTDSRAVVVGENPPVLSRFAPEMHQIVERLGGIEASPYVWGTFQVHHELPQLMPNIQLVFSRDKFMRPADDPDYRAIAMRAFNAYTQNVVEPAVYDRLFKLYPIDHVVVDRGYAEAAKALGEYLAGRGWSVIGRTERRYEIWRAPEASSAATQ